MSALYWLCVGGGLGWLFIYSQVITVRHFYLRDMRDLAWCLLVSFVLRLLMCAVALLLALRQGLTPTLYLLCGFWLMRSVLVQRIHTGRAFYKQLRS
ncbi:MAG: hypothetical protein JW892_10785 [Anaerolineae bacterium]|nr:hypothetical protein [Anaerolineae bacterium]